MRKKAIRVLLDEDTAEFLALAQSNPNANVSNFINSLLRQERFRQGYPAHAGSGGIRPTPITNPIEKAMLQRSGLLPLPGKY